MFLEFAVAGAIVGILVTFGVPRVQAFVNGFIPATWQNNVVVPVLVTGAIVVGGLVLLKKIGAGKYIERVV